MWASRTPPQSARKDDKKTNTKERQRKWCAPRMQYTFYIYFAYLRVENMRVVRLCILEVYRWQKETLSTGYMCLSPWYYQEERCITGTFHWQDGILRVPRTCPYQGTTIPRWLHEFMMGHNDFTRVAIELRHPPHILLSSSFSVIDQTLRTPDLLMPDALHTASLPEPAIDTLR